MKRIFIGLPIESESALQLAETWRNDRPLNQNRLIWVSPDNWHITLYFLGDTQEFIIELLQQLIEESFSQTPAFTTQLIGTGLFPNNHHPKVLWLGIENLQLLMSGYLHLGDLLRNNGLSLDNKPLKPHLTLARIRNLNYRAAFESMLKGYQNYNFGNIAINRVTLYESTLTPNGPVYTPLFEKQLIS